MNNNQKALDLLNKVLNDVMDERIKRLEEIKHKLAELNRGFVV